jgi:hypothetical protein
LQVPPLEQCHVEAVDGVLWGWSLRVDRGMEIRVIHDVTSKLDLPDLTRPVIVC